MSKIFEINENSEKRYMHGWVNLIIRLYYYVQEGMQQLTGLRTLAYGLIALAGVFAIAKSGRYWLVVLIGLGSVPLIGILGWLWVTRGKKSTEYYQLRYTSPYGKYGIEMQEETLRIQQENANSLKEILAVLKQKQ